MKKKGYKKGAITQSLRSNVIERDNNICQNCGQSRNLQVHHIDKKEDNNALNNLITLCKNCHRRIHNHGVGVGEGEWQGGGKLKEYGEEFTEYWHGGKTYNEIMHFFDISFATVNNWRRTLGLQRRQNVKNLSNGFKYNNNGTIRISLDVTQGTFNRLEELCNEEFQNKAGVLRECLNNRFKEEGNKK